MVYRFSGFTLNAAAGTLRRGDEAVRLRPRSFKLLEYLVRHPGQVKSKSELIEAVWGPVAITDDAVAQSVIDIRRALGDKEHELVRTLPRRGYLLDVPVEAVSVAPAQPVPPVRSAGKIWGAVLLVTLAALGTAVLLKERPGPTEASDYAIAVLPFDDLSEAQDLRYFADGISEEILNLLAPLPDLRVIARTSSFAFRDEKPDIQTISERLNVTHVLEGSVRFADGRFRITTQLIETARSGHLWSETYEVPQSDIFAVQDQIAGAVREQLKLALQGPLGRDSRGDIDPEAYRLFLHSKHLIDSGDPFRHDDAEALLQAALALEPDYASAWRELARLHWRRIRPGETMEKDIAETKVLLDRALASDPLDPATLAYYGWHAADFDSDLPRGARMVQRALSIDPQHEDVLRIATTFARVLLSPEDTLVFAERTFENNPLCPICLFNLYRSHLEAGNLDEALTYVLRHRTMFRGGHFSEGLIHLAAGRNAEAMTAFEAEATDPFRNAGLAMAAWRLGLRGQYQNSVGKLEAMVDAVPDAVDERDLFFLLAQVYANSDRFDEAFGALDRYVALNRVTREGKTIRSGIIFLGQLRRPILSPLHDDPRWQQLMAELGIDLAPDQSAFLALTD